uniref:t-SNARE coiled-coil homology domain-containing protein n=1 Tax=Octactis speculum TaxID=3111310 RepID=A0A7S2CNJ6_9STRA|mmetsp:Transcript_3735/g.4309  ORF Transcript_3735/g.4309 Transcript_3735/m.4309 type:complete len:210 (+) Transcript_3735:38-667(+)
MNKSQFAWIGSVAAIGVLALFRLRPFRRWLSIIWEGDVEGFAMQQELKKIDVIKKCAQSCALTLKSLNRQLTQLEKDFNEKKDAQITMPNKPANPDSSEPPAHAAAASSYYHFDSNGKKLKSKWDSYNVDDELRRLDGDDDLGEKTARIKRELRQLHEELWHQQEYVDSIQGGLGGGDIIRSHRKVAVGTITANMKILDDLNQRASSLP